LAVNLKDGSVLWNKILDKKVLKSAPAVSKKYVFVLTSDNVLHSFRRVGGSEDFKHKGLPVLTSFEKGAKVVVDRNQNIVVPFSNGEIHYLTSRGRFLFASNVKNYRGVKEANLLKDIVGEPVVDGDKVVVAGMANSLKVINLRNAKVLWEKDLKVVSKPVVAYGYVFVQDENGNIFAFGEDSAKVYWKNKLPKLEGGAVWFGPVENSGKLLFSSSDGRLLVLDMKSGEELFIKKLYDDGFAQEVIVSGENIILTMEDGEIKILR
jgi:outer membrane protein assembly factor BamB